MLQSVLPYITETSRIQAPVQGDLYHLDLRGKLAKYELKYLSLFSSFKSMAGMLGNGFLQTNSPLSPSGNSVPSAEYTAMSMPKAFTASSPG